MKRFLLMLGIICFLSFSITGCSEAPDNKGTATDRAVEDDRKPIGPGIEKTKEEVAETKKGDQQVIEDTEKMPGKVVESTKEGTADISLMRLKIEHRTLKRLLHPSLRRKAMQP